MKINIKFIRLILEDARIVSSVFIGSILILLINLIPVDILNKFSISNWLPTINHIVFFALLISLFPGLYHIIIYFQKKNSEYRKEKELEKKVEEIKQAQEELFNDKDAIKVLEQLYEEHPHAVYLSMNNQKVRLLDQYLLIVRTSGNGYGCDGNFYVPYVLQTFTENRLNEIYKNKVIKE